MKHQLEKDFLILLEEYQRIPHSVCKIYTDTQVDHEDLFQEMVMQLWKGYQQYKGEAKLSTWIYRVCLFTGITYIKKVVKLRDALKDYPVENSTTIKTQESDEELLLECIKTLNETDRGFILLYLENKSYKEMSDILGLTESNVGVKLNRIKKKLKKLMTRLWI